MSGQEQGLLRHRSLGVPGNQMPSSALGALCCNFCNGEAKSMAEIDRISAVWQGKGL